MSTESYIIINEDEVNKYLSLPWFNKECYNIPGKGWVIPEKYLQKELDKKRFYRSKMEELLKEFNFEKVRKVMGILGWTWAGIPGTPNKEDMIEVVKGLYKSIEEKILNGVYTYCATGGFKLAYNPDEDNELSLVFEAVSYSVYGD